MEYKADGQAKGVLRERLLDYSVRIIKLSQALPRSVVGRHIAKQVLRSGTSAGANCEEARGAESRADFVHKMQIVLKELRETDYWLSVIEKAGIVPAARMNAIRSESSELVAMVVRSTLTAKSKLTDG